MMQYKRVWIKEHARMLEKGVLIKVKGHWRKSPTKRRKKTKRWSW